MHEMTKNLKLIERSVAKVGPLPWGLILMLMLLLLLPLLRLLLMLHSKLLIKLTLGVDLRDALRLEERYVYCKDKEHSEKDT